MSIQPLQTWIHGISGRMGQELKTLIQKSTKRFVFAGGSAEQFETADSLHGQALDPKDLAQRLGKVQLLLDFSAPAGNAALLNAMRQTVNSNLAVLIGTTGLDAAVAESWRKLASEKNIRVLYAPNTSLGILLLQRATKDLTKILRQHDFDIEISEIHHRDKKDAPSGTALLLAQAAQAAVPDLEIVYGRSGTRKGREIGIQSLRGGHVFGEHTVMFMGDHEEVHIAHRALSRSLFASGALTLGTWLSGREHSGFYTLDDVAIEDLLT